MAERRADGTWWPYLMDFGLAREVDAQSSTTTGAVEGTPAFMSPEQAFGSVRGLDHRTDIYSLGATLYVLLTGKLPFSGNSVDVLFEILTKEPIRPRKIDPSLPMDLEVLVLKCMEKQPKLRYASAKALAEDLSRYLAGGRIAARPPGLGQRLVKFGQRHRLLVASAGAALVASLVLGGVALRARWQAEGQARLAQELGQDIKEIELFMRAAYGLPLHDIAREQAVVRSRMEQLKNKLRAADSRTVAALRYALGRGHMVLREYPEAQAELEQAWQSGYRTSEMRLALGLVLGERYRQELDQTQRVGDKKWIEAREQELAAQYLKPALGYLEGARSNTEAPSYIQGLLAFYRKQYAEALTAAQQAQTEAPWLAEPLKLEGDVYQVMGIQQLDSGQQRDARALLTRAALQHQAATAISSSDSAMHEAEAIDWIRIMEIDRDTGSPIEASLKSAINATDNTIVANPRSATGYQLKSWAYWRAGFTKNGRGQDGEPELKLAVDLAQKSILLNPADWQSHYFYSLAIGEFANKAGARGSDALELRQKSIAGFKETVRLNKNFAWAWNDLGIQYMLLFDQKLHSGIYVQQTFLDADMSFTKSSQINSNYANIYENQTYLYMISIEFRMRHGEDIQQQIMAAIKLSEKSIAIKKAGLSYINLSAIILDKIEYMSWSAAVPNDLFTQASEALAHARTLNPEYALIAENSAWLHVLQAKNELQSGRDPQQAIAEGLRVIAAAEPKDPKNYSLALYKSRLHVVAGQARGGDERADAAFAQAVSAARHAVELAPKEAEPHSVLGEALRYAAAARSGRRQVTPAHTAAQAGETARWISDGLDACTAALGINSTSATAYGNRGALLLIKAQRTSDAAARQLAAGQSVQALRQALTINKWLRRDYAPFLDAAQCLLSSSPAP